MRIALVSTPWPLFNRPSIQLAALKAFLSSRLPEVKVDALHLYLPVAASIGYPTYEEISQSTWLAEPLYGALLYPEQSPHIQKAWRKRAARCKQFRHASFEKICKTLEHTSLDILSKHDWTQYRVIGFSICFSQLTSSLYFVKKIRENSPESFIVVGGSTCAGELGKSLVASFPEINCVIEGEGELPLLSLVQEIMNHKGSGTVLCGVSSVRPAEQIPRMDELPLPDYEDYFTGLKDLGPAKSFLPRIPVEMSRGCWWNRCTFCNLNLQWKGYRSKSNAKMISELARLSDKYQVLGFSFMDNLLPQKGLQPFFDEIAGINRDFEFFAEIRARTPVTTLEVMARAGMREVQVGIEALSSSLLKKLKKGTTAMDNIEIMKHCETPGFPRLTGNIIMEFPGSDDTDVDQTLKNLDFVLPFRPLKPIPFWLGYGSPVWANPRCYGLRKVFNHPNYRQIFPKSVLNTLLTMIQGYHGQIREQRRRWQPVTRRVAEWTNRYAALHQDSRSEPIVSYRDGGQFLIIRERRANAYPMTHKLKGASRKIYLFCETQRRITEIVGRFPSFTAEQIENFLKMMVDKRLMFQEGDRYLSLAVPARA